MNLAALNALPAEQAEAALLACCGSTAWARAMAAKRPFGAAADLYAASETLWWELQPADWLEAFRRHPKIGERQAAADSAGRSAGEKDWSAQEQSAMQAAARATHDALAAGNAQYERRFGYIFIVCATGKTADQMLALLRQRLQNDAVTELRIAAAEQARITRLRLEKLAGREMIPITPVRISGRWKDGFALDCHIVSSKYLGDDEFGHPQFETKRTPIGEKLYRLKYGNDTSVVPELAETAADFVRSWNPGASLVVPIPGSRPDRKVALILAEAIASSLNIPVNVNCIARTKSLPQLKNIRALSERLPLLRGAHEIRSDIAGQKVLLFDDVFQSGATLNAVAEVLYDRGEVADVFALTVTITQRPK